MSSSQAKLKQNGPNYVAINQDWEQRVRSENEAAKGWHSSWGSLYAKGQPGDNKGKIEKVRNTLKNLPVTSMMTNNQLSYGHVKAYADIGDEFYRKSMDLNNNSTDLDALEGGQICHTFQTNVEP